MDVIHLVYRLDVQGIHPGGILSNIRFAGRHDDVVGESNLFALLTELIVAILILQGIDAVRTRCHTLDDKAAATVGTAHSQHRLGSEGRIGMVGIQSHQDTLDRFQILRFQHMPRYLHGINGSSRRETVGIVSHRIALVVIADGIREVDGVGGIRLE